MTVTAKKTKIKPVVNFEGVQKDSEAEPTGAPPAKRPSTKSHGRSSMAQHRTQSSPPASKRHSTSVRLTPEDQRALDDVRGPRSRSHYIVQALQERMAREGGHSFPPSLGIADGIHGATIHDDVVALANHLGAFEFLALRILDRMPPGQEADELQKYFSDARRLMWKAAGKPYARDERAG